MRSSRIACSGAAILALLLSVTVSATAAAEPGLTIRDAWARAPAVPGRNGAAYMTLVNEGEAARRLVAVDTEASKRAELHRSIMDDGVMTMVEQDAIAIPAGGTTVLKPGDFHIMLMGATESVKAGTTIPLSLRFDDGTIRHVTADVVGPGQTPDITQ
jgi:copper(I)-binding protein